MPYDAKAIDRMVEPTGQTTSIVFPSHVSAHTSTAARCAEVEGVALRDAGRLREAGGEALMLAVVQPTQLADTVAETLPEPLDDDVEVPVRRGVAVVLREGGAEGEPDAGTQPMTTRSASGAPPPPLAPPPSPHTPGSPSTSRVTDTLHVSSSGAAEPGAGRHAAATVSAAADELHAPLAANAGHAPVGSPNDTNGSEKSDRPAPHEMTAVSPSAAAAHSSVTLAGGAVAEGDGVAEGDAESDGDDVSDGEGVPSGVSEGGGGGVSEGVCARAAVASSNKTAAAAAAGRPARRRHAEPRPAASMRRSSGRGARRASRAFPRRGVRRRRRIPAPSSVIWRATHPSPSP